MSSINLFALKISRLIASAGSLALSILPCSIGSRGARLNGLQASCAPAGQARIETTKPAQIQDRTRRATRRDDDGRARHVGRNIVPAGASGEQTTWECICVVIMLSRIYLRKWPRRIDEPQAIAFSNPLSASSQGASRTLSAACRISKLRLAYSERRNNGRILAHIFDCGVVCSA